MSHHHISFSTPPLLFCIRLYAAANLEDKHNLIKQVKKTGFLSVFITACSINASVKRRDGATPATIKWILPPLCHRPDTALPPPPSWQHDNDPNPLLMVIKNPGTASKSPSSRTNYHKGRLASTSLWRLETWCVSSGGGEGGKGEVMGGKRG